MRRSIIFHHHQLIYFTDKSLSLSSYPPHRIVATFEHKLEAAQVLRFARTPACDDVAGSATCLLFRSLRSDPGLDTAFCPSLCASKCMQRIDGLLYGQRLALRAPVSLFLSFSLEDLQHSKLVTHLYAHPHTHTHTRTHTPLVTWNLINSIVCRLQTSAANLCLLFACFYFPHSSPQGPAQPQPAHGSAGTATPPGRTGADGSRRT